MLHVKLIKVKVLPQKLQPDTLYFVDNGSFAETYLTDKQCIPKMVGNTGMIQQVSNAGGDKNYIFDQGIPSDVWIIPHYLGKKPSVTVIDTAGTECTGEVQHIDNNKLIIKFNNSFSGIATLN